MTIIFKIYYKFFKGNGKLVDLEEADPSILHIYSRQALKMIQNGEANWEDMLPSGIAEIIKTQQLFGYEPEETVSQYSSH